MADITFLSKVLKDPGQLSPGWLVQYETMLQLKVKAFNTSRDTLLNLPEFTAGIDTLLSKFLWIHAGASNLELKRELFLPCWVKLFLILRICVGYAKFCAKMVSFLILFTLYLNKHKSMVCSTYFK